MSKVKLPSGQSVIWKDDDFPSVYTNIMSFSVSPFDISFTLGEIGDATPTVVHAKPKVKILLAPEQAANLMKLLNVALQAYVQNNGVLRLGGAVNLDEVNEQIQAASEKTKASQ